MSEQLPPRHRTASERTAAALRAIAGPRLYRHNAFRVTGLPTDADRKAVRQRRRQVLAALEAGADVDLGHPLPVGLEEARAAFDLLLDSPHRRLVDELFWLWGESSTGCGCVGTLHRDHDAAVLAHSAALDRETAGGDLTDEELDEVEKLWSTAGQRWGRVLRRAAFWNHVLDRIAALGERQLDESVLDALREGVPLTLLRPLIDLAAGSTDEQGWLADQARAWPGVRARVIDEQLEEAVADRFDAARAAMTTAGELLHGGEPESAASLVYHQVLPCLAQLDAVVPHRRHRRTATTRNDTALLLNNCATALIDRDGPVAATNARRWLGTARELTSDAEALATIDANTGTLEEIVRGFAAIEAKIAELTAARRSDLAREMLLDIKRHLRGGPGTAEIDRLLAGLGGQKRWTAGSADRDRRRALAGLGVDPDEAGDAYPGAPGPRYPRPAERSRAVRGGGGEMPDLSARTGFWWLLWYAPELIAAGLIVAVSVVVGLVWPKPEATAAFFAETIAGNAVAGTCIASKDGWNGDKSRVPVAACDAEHWGEVLGYVKLGAVPSPYPGPDQTPALARFECGFLLAQQGLPAGRYATDFAYPGQESWNSGGHKGENYATCVLHRIDDGALPARQLLNTGPKSSEIAVPMDLYGPAVSGNAPAGTCIESKVDDPTPPRNVPIVRCDRPHWAEILGYPVLYQPGSTWPGDNAVYAAASEACRKVAAERSLPAEYRFDVRWPAKAWWDNPKATLYAGCTARRTDDRTFTGGAR
ncbi:septum formation family protein [Amycolatopsis samaneae]|uniref:Septum formation family protein n=1 Tax=Amycolatopsis samaneae TaxID=664691 RepID=A0ABW5GAK2_9PSEU